LNPFAAVIENMCINHGSRFLRRSCRVELHSTFVLAAGGANKRWSGNPASRDYRPFVGVEKYSAFFYAK
jgi:hypothetical protein